MYCGISARSMRLPTKQGKDLLFRSLHSASCIAKANYKLASLIIAADVIYSDDLTDAFFKTLERLMKLRPEKVWLGK